MAKKVKTLYTEINTQFYSFNESHNLLKNSKFADSEICTDEAEYAVDKCIKKIAEEISSKCMLSDLWDPQNKESNYSLITIDNYEKLARKSKDKNGKRDNDNLVYELISKRCKTNWNQNESDSKGKIHYTVSTGIYCGIMELNDKKLVIDYGYSKRWFKRMLDFCCGIYVDNTIGPAALDIEQIYALLPEYMFLISLRKVIVKTFPKKYKKVYDRGYSINGAFDFNEYLKNDLLAFDHKITYYQNKQLESQNIVDILYTAIQMCRMNSENNIIPNLTKYKNYLHGLYSRRRPCFATIQNALSDGILSNSLYADYKAPLKYAQVLIGHRTISPDNEKTNDYGTSGILVDASFLWEMYLYNLMRLKLSDDWDISAQSEINFYKDTFYNKSNYPDFVLTNRRNGSIFVLDAKFKTMKFQNYDVDNSDLQQLHSYSYYYHLTEGEHFKGSALIYPTKDDKPDEKNNIADMFGISGSERKFAVLYVKDPGDDGDVKTSENDFIEALKSFLES